MNKNAYGFWNLSIDGYYKEAERIDTTGSWIYDTTRTPTGNGWPIYYNMELVNYVGTITPWRYRFIDSTYAANGRYSIYSFTSHDEGNSYMSGDYCYFNEAGYLVVDTPKEGNVFYLDSYGRLTDVVFGLKEVYGIIKIDAKNHKKEKTTHEKITDNPNSRNHGGKYEHDSICRRMADK